MTFYIENESEQKFAFEPEEIAGMVAKETLQSEKCTYEVQINLLVTDNEGIKTYNKEYRNIDNPTDVLSFPNIDYEVPADFSLVRGQEASYLDPETGELILGDIIISADKVISQAEEYGHSIKREFAFLTAHSMLHLLGYDHMNKEDAQVMEEKQNSILDALHITRDKF